MFFERNNAQFFVLPFLGLFSNLLVFGPFGLRKKQNVCFQANIVVLVKFNTFNKFNVCSINKVIKIL